MSKKGVIIAVLSFVFLVGILFTQAINLFDGEIVYRVGSSQTIQKVNLSLSYFVGLGYDENDLVDVIDFYLTVKGKLFAVCVLFGFPVLIGLIVSRKRA